MPKITSYNCEFCGNTTDKLDDGWISIDTITAYKKIPEDEFEDEDDELSNKPHALEDFLDEDTIDDLCFCSAKCFESYLPTLAEKVTNLANKS